MFSLCFLLRLMSLLFWLLEHFSMKHLQAQGFISHHKLNGVRSVRIGAVLSKTLNHSLNRLTLS
jgi:hypothetical protein